jgi:putative MATE family efflux protein
LKNLTKGNIYKTFFLFGLPLVLSGLLSQAYGIVDTAIAGKFLGDKGLAAMGATAPLITFISSVFWGLSSGFCIYIARLFAAKEYKKIKSAVYTMWLIMFIACIAVGVLFIALHNPLFDLLKIEEGLRETAFDYFSVYAIGLFPIIITVHAVHLLNAFGIGSFPFVMSLLSAVINVSGNILSVVVLKMGVEGLALSSVLSASIVCVCYYFKFRGCLKEMGVDKERVRLGVRYLKNAAPFAIPNMTQQAIMYFAALAISPLVNGLGVAATASYSVVMRVYELNTSVYHNSTRAPTNYAAQCTGQKQYDKIKKGVFVGLLQSVALTTPFVLACVIFHKPVCSLFFKADADAMTKEYAYIFARQYLPFIYLQIVCNLFHGLFRGVKATGHLFASTFTGAAAQYLLSALLIPSMGMSGFYLGWILAWAIEAVLCFVLFFLDGWNPAHTDPDYPQKEIKSANA